MGRIILCFRCKLWGISRCMSYQQCQSLAQLWSATPPFHGCSVLDCIHCTASQNLCTVFPIHTCVGSWRLCLLIYPKRRKVGVDQRSRFDKGGSALGTGASGWLWRNHCSSIFSKATSTAFSTCLISSLHLLLLLPSFVLPLRLVVHAIPQSHIGSSSPSPAFFDYCPVFLSLPFFPTQITIATQEAHSQGDQTRTAAQAQSPTPPPSAPTASAARSGYSARPCSPA